MRSILISIILLSSFYVSASENNQNEKKLTDAANKSVKEPLCPNAKKVKNLCMFVSGMSEEAEPTKDYKYPYQKRILEAACVDFGQESQATQAEKASQMWTRFEGQLKCSSNLFDIDNGSIIKFAAIRHFDSFIDDVIKWKVNLNVIDKVDGRTILDYLKYHIERTKGGSIEIQLQVYYERLRKAGAKHKSEL